MNILVSNINHCGQKDFLSKSATKYMHARCATFKKMRFIILIILIFTSYFGQSQSYLTSEVIEKAELYLKEAVGEELFEYFELDPDSYYEYKSIFGKTKWRGIIKGKRTKGNFVNGHDIRFTLNHPDFQYAGVNKNIYIELDNKLNLDKKIELDKIPIFLLRNEPSNWLTEIKLDSIVVSKKLKTSVKPIIKNLCFDYVNGEYYWMIINVLSEGELSFDSELLYIDPITGVVKKQSEERFIKYRN